MISFEASQITSLYFENHKIVKRYLGNDLIYSSQPQLDTPTNLSVTDTTASFDEVENAESYEFFVDDVSIGEYSTQTGYEVTVSLTNPWLTDGFVSFYIYDNAAHTGDSIGEIDSPTGSTTVTTTTGTICVVATALYAAQFDNTQVSVTGGASLTSISGDYPSNVAEFAITGDGTITIDGIIWVD